MTKLLQVEREDSRFRSLMAAQLAASKGESLHHTTTAAEHVEEVTEVEELVSETTARSS